MFLKKYLQDIKNIKDWKYYRRATEASSEISHQSTPSFTRELEGLKLDYIYNIKSPPTSIDYNKIIRDLNKLEKQ